MTIDSKNFDSVFTLDTVRFLTALHERFEKPRLSLLADRVERQKQIDAGNMPDFLPETKYIREDSTWKISDLPLDLQDRRVEITGPTDRKMVINALNSGANVFMADFEDSNSPTWSNIIDGQVNLKDAVNKTITFISYQDHVGKYYRLKPDTAVLMVRPRGLHLMENNCFITGEPICGSLFDFGVYFFQNARTLIKDGTGPYFYLPKLQSHLEARWWNDIFTFSEDYLSIEHGKIKATVLIEHVLAAFEADEILYELREHSAGLNCGRWDYIFSFIKTFHKYPEFVLPDRSNITMMTDFMRAYCLYVIKTCHKRSAPAMGGMAAQIPIKNNPEANNLAMAKVRADKEREVADGFIGSWVAHPGLVNLAKEVFSSMPYSNQINKQLDITITASDLLKMPDGEITENGIRTNIDIGVQYLAAWLRGQGCVPINNLMEDLATIEISRSQIWQWIAHKKLMTVDFDSILDSEKSKIKSSMNEQQFVEKKYELSFSIFHRISTSEDPIEFLSTIAYPYLSGDTYGPFGSKADIE